ncbi:MAG: SRPBCC family protein [Proteobacteria bacterium]|nr:SRPBCC family protein [Pseudomonadota bacterium]
MLKKTLLVLLVGIGAFGVYAGSRPGAYRVERSTTIDAPAAVVFEQLDNFKVWAAWSPWEKLDPAMKRTFSGPERGVGAIYEWEGNDEVGKGRMTIVESDAPTRLKCRLEFMQPFEAQADTQFDLSGEGDGTPVSVTWSMSGENNFVAKVFGVFMDMEAMIEQDYDKGLAALKGLAEAESAKRKQEAARLAETNRLAETATNSKTAGAVEAGTATPEGIAAKQQATAAK